MAISDVNYIFQSRMVKPNILAYVLFLEKNYPYKESMICPFKVFADNVLCSVKKCLCNDVYKRYVYSKK